MSDITIDLTTEGGPQHFLTPGEYDFARVHLRGALEELLAVRHFVSGDIVATLAVQAVRGNAHTLDDVIAARRKLAATPSMMNRPPDRSAEIASLKSGRIVGIRPVGRSMEPLIGHGYLVTLCPVRKTADVAIGTVVLARVGSRVLLHRVAEIKDRPINPAGDKPGEHELDDPDSRRMYRLSNFAGRDDGWADEVYGFATRWEVMPQPRIGERCVGLGVCADNPLASWYSVKTSRWFCATCAKLLNDAYGGRAVDSAPIPPMTVPPEPAHDPPRS